MKKSLIAFAAIATASLGMVSAAEAKTDIVIGVGLPGFYVAGGHGYVGHHYSHRPYHVRPARYYYEPDCGWETVKLVKWKHGRKVVKYKKQWICD